MNVVLFACVHNAGRSQMAAALFNEAADQGVARAVSAGTQPATEVHPEVVTTMRELGLELSNVKPRLLTDDLAHSARVLVTMGCGEACPLVARLERIDWQIADPKGRPAEEVRQIRDDVRGRVLRLLRERGWLRSSSTG